MNSAFYFLKTLIVVILYGTAFYRDSISQCPPYYHYTSSEGLSSSSVYDMIQDRNGFMWFVTANGVNKFDGHSFVNYNTADGLNSSSIINLIEGPNGEIYFGNYEKGINIFMDGKIDNYSEHAEKNKAMKGFFLDGKNLFTYNLENVSFIKSGKDSNLYKFPLKDSLLLNKIVKLTDGAIIAGTTKGFYKFANFELNKLNIKGFDDQEIFWLNESSDNEIIAGAAGKIFEIKNNEVIRTIDVALFNNNNVIRLIKDSKENIWFSIMNKGFFFIKKGSSEIVNIGKLLGMEKAIVSNFLEDNENNIWVSTYGDGILCLNNLYVSNYNQKNGLSNNKVLAIEKDPSNRILIGTLDGLNMLENDSIKIIKAKASSFKDYMYIFGIKRINDFIYIAGTFASHNQFVIQNYASDKLYMFVSSAFLKTKDNMFINGGWSNAIYTQQFPPKYVLGDTTYLFNDKNFINKVYDIYQDSRNNLWVGTASGLCKIAYGEKTFFSSNEILNSTVKSIIEDKKEKVWFAGDKGIASYGLKDSVITNYSKIMDFDLTSANILSIDNTGRLWIGTMNGLFVVSNDSVKNLNYETGLPSSEILTLFSDTAKNYMWVGTANGFSSLNIHDLDNYSISPLNIKVKSVKAEDSLYLNSSKYIFEPGTKNIRISFAAINYSSPGSVMYQYKIKNEWINIPDDYVNFAFPEKGDYNVAIRGKVINSQWGKPEIISFIVQPYFTETILFRGSIAVLLILGILFAAHKRIKYIKARSKEKLETNNQINELKHKALSSMMNPHFIFNSLNSVQHLVNIDKKREANDYISLMAKLIRMNLDSASQSYIRLDEEIKRLDLYLKIEKLRFSDKFEYDIFTGNEVDRESITIPNMIIQPFVENSIWHGIMPSEREGLIKISFNFENVSVDGTSFRFLVIRITDNGVGLTEAQMNKKENHNSIGIRIIQERLTLLSKEKQIPRPVIRDLNIKNKNTQGTEVILSIPPDLYKSE